MSQQLEIRIHNANKMCVNIISVLEMIENLNGNVNERLFLLNVHDT